MSIWVPHRAAATGFAAIGAAMLVGCAGLTPRIADSWPLTAKDAASPAPTTTVDAETTDDQRTYQDRLAAIEQFLERTRDYQSQSIDLQSTPQVTIGSGEGLSSYVADSRVAQTTPPTSGVSAMANMQLALTRVAENALALPVLRSVTVRSKPISPSPSELVSRDTTNTPMDLDDAGETTSWESMLTQLRERAERTRDFDSHWQLKLVQLALGRDTMATDDANLVSLEIRELMRAFFEVAVAIRNTMRNPLDGGEVALTYIDDLRTRLADRSDPSIDSIALCSRVTTFGVYEEMTASDFIAGRPTQTIVYSEIGGLHAELLDGGHFQTKLATSLEILTNDGKHMWDREEPEITDRCRRRRTDFFVAQRITLPGTLPAGDYVLKVRVEDRISGRTNEALHPFTVSSALSLANSR